MNTTKMRDIKVEDLRQQYNVLNSEYIFEFDLFQFFFNMHFPTQMNGELNYRQQVLQLYINQIEESICTEAANSLEKQKREPI